MHEAFGSVMTWAIDVGAGELVKGLAVDWGVIAVDTVGGFEDPVDGL
jgi:hypothetical protein